MISPPAPQDQSRQRELARELLSVTRQHWAHLRADQDRAYAHAIHTARLLGMTWRGLADVLEISDRTARNIYASHYSRPAQDHHDRPDRTDT